MQKFADSPIAELVALVGYEQAALDLGLDVKAVKSLVIEGMAKDDPYFFDESSLRIRTKQGKLVPLINNTGQRKLQEAINRQVASGRPVRIKMPKARQFGGSTKTQAKFFRDCRYESHIQMLTVCHDLDSARNMRAMFERFYENFPRQFPKYKKVSEKWWKFPSKDIDYLIDTAEELDTGRSFTIHRLHASEVAFYRDPETLMLGLLQAVPDDPNTIVVLESTANGMGGWWYDLVMGDNDYELVFVGWHEIEEYTRPFTSDKEKIDFERSLGQYEKTILENYSLTLEQLNWRRYTVSNKLNGDEDKFRQEFPITAEESFIASGRNYFRVTDIRENLAKAKKHQDEISVGFLEWKKYGEEVEFVQDNQGWWKIQEFPEKQFANLYVTGSDPAEGKDSNKEGTKANPDYSVCTVWDRKNNRVMARFRARIDTDGFENEIYKANKFFGSCIDVVELNNTAGGAVIKGLKDKESINLYRRELQGKVDEKETEEYGYRTSSGAGGSREILLSDLRRAIKDGRYTDYDADFWNEALVFVVDKTGKPSAMIGKHDDTIFSSGLALQGASQATEVYPIIRAEEKEDTPLDADVVWNDVETQTSVIAEF